ncbi:hypothetical protein AB0I39_21615 [Kitasatospora purpeofusca]|uniref:DUF7927 domain-containing protein n=1 Tax=Kitasatospora purpeofusca TaxID=67352 RepID=UPI003402FFB8
MAPVRSLLGGRFRTTMRGALAILCLVPQGGLALAAAPPAYGPQSPPREERALTACTPSGGFTNCTRVTYSGGDQTFTVPAGVTAVYARVFGAGGAGSPRAYYTGQYGGGGGGYTTGTLAVTPGQALTLTVGQGGRMNSTSSTYGGGGAGGQGFTNAGGASATGGSGGGMSAVWNGASGTNPLVVAGGGGGSSPGADATTPAAGGGGGSNGGQDNQPAASGRGGTQSAGGAAATQTACAAATAGSQYQGGRGAAAPQYEGGGGGGGGYYGGGGGACQRGGTLDANGMGGGGSGYNRGTGVTNTQTSNGTNSNGNGVGGTSGGRSDAQYTSGSGIGDGGGFTDGGNGEIVLEWVTQVGLSVKKTASPTTYVPGQRLTYTFVVSNAGPAPAVNAAVRDALPSALSGFTWTCASGGTGSSCGAASGTGSPDTTATIAANSSVTYTVTGIVPSATTGTLSNTATVTRPAATTDPNCGPTCSSTVDTPGRVTTGLSVTKTPDRNPYVPGQPLTYTIVVKNDGPSDAVGTSVRDTLPTTIRNFTWTCTAAGGGSCGTPASGTGDINTTADLPAGGQVTYRLTGTVPADATGSLDNRATVTPPGGATDPNCSPSCTSTANPVPPGNQANLVVSKTLLTSPVVPGQQVKWQVKVTNNGPSRARNVVVTDQVPAGVTAAGMANDQDGTACPISGGTATCPAVEIPVNGTASWTLTGTLDPNATTTPTNTALVTGGPDPSASTRTAVASPTASPSPQANLTISKTLLTNPVVPGAQIQWRVTVTNNGPSRARNVVVTDQVPAGVTGATMRQGVDGANCPVSGGTATCPAVEIPAGSSQTWTLTGTLDPNATVTPTNTAVVTGGPDPGATARTAVASPTASPSPQANLTVSKSLLTSPVVPGQPVQWRVTVTNNGPSRARNVVVADQVPASVTGASMTADTGGANCPISGGIATCPAVEIPAGSSLSWTLTGTLDANATTTPTNTVTVTGGPDPSASTRTAVASPSGSPSPQADLKVSKSLVTNPVVPGQRIEWRVNVFNSGPSRARNVVVTDTVPAGVNNPVMTADTGGANCPISGGVATCPAVEIPAGQALNWTLTGTLDPNATATPTNTVTVTGGPDPSASTRTAVASPSASPSPQANLTVSKSLLTSPVVPGQQIQWRVTVTNNGPSRARDVVVRDQVPTGVSGATMTADTGGANCPVSGGVATCPAVELSAGSSLSWTLTGTLDANATTTPSNTVTVTGGPDPATPTHTAVASPSGSPSPQANLTVSKVLLTDPVVPGRQIQWRVTVTNNGPSRARNVVVSDQVPAGVDNPVMTASDGTGCPISGGVATCPAVEIPAGSSQTWTLTGTLASDATSTPVNSVTVTGGPDPSASTRTAVASPSASPSPQANLTVSKSLLTNPVVPGQQVQWRVTVTNNGPSRARNVVVADQVPAGVSGASMTADTGGANCPISGGVATCPAVEIPAGSSLSWTLTGTLDANATTTPTNTATVTGGPDPATPTHTAVASPTNTPTAQANLTVSKSLLTNPVVPGQQIQWRVTVTNNGPSRARNVIVTDQVPTGVSGASMTADTGGANCPISGGIATCPAVEIPAGSSLSWTLTGTLDANATTTPTNTATVTGGPDPATPTHTAVASPTNTPTAQANLTASKVLLTNPVVPGQQIQWRVSVTNNGPSRARDVVVTDTVPAGVAGASMKADTDNTPCPISNGTATCPAVEIPAGQTLTWTLTGTLTQDATVTPTNTATVTGGPDPATPTHTAVASPTNSPTVQANLTASKVLLTNPVVPGQQIQWQVSVTNNGPSRARNVIVTDRVPDGVSGPSMTAADGTVCPVTDGTAVCPAVEIPAGSSMTWTLTGTLAQDATVTPTNTATVTGGPDPATPTHTAVASPTNTPTPQANLTVSKSLLTNPVVPGQQIQWQVSVTNNGPSRARDVVVTDTVPAGVNNPAMTATDGTNCPINGGTATCPAVEIPVGQTITWTLTGTLAQDATVTPTNTATVTGGPDPATPTHTAVASPTNSPTPQANLTVSKVLLTNPVVPGQQIQWQVSVTNDGPSRARDVVVTDTVPAGVNNPAMTTADGTNCPISNGIATCPAVEIPAGSSMTWTLTGTLTQDATVTPTNTATVTGGPDPATPTHTAVASPTNSPTPQANLTASKVLLTNPVVPGQQIQWQVSVTNNGPSRARDVVVTDRVPDGVSGPSMTAADGTVCPVTDGTAVCPAVELEVGQTVSYTLSGTLMQDATVTPTNTAVVAGGPDPATPTHTAVASPTDSPSPRASLTVAKALLTDPVVPGEVVQWRVTVTNNGPSKARNVVITDRIPAGVSDAVLQSDADASDCPISTGLATCPAIELEVGQTISYTLTARLAPDATVTPTNTVVVAGGPDPATPTHTAVASPTAVPTPQANLSIAKSLVTNPVVPGQQIQWRVTVTNHGPSRARNVVVTDTVPAQVNSAAMTSDADGTDCPITGGTATCPAVEIPADGSVSYTVTGTLDPAATSTPVNVAVVTGGPDPTATAHTATAQASETVEPRASLSVSKALLTDPVVPGETIVWRISVTNNGPSLARDVVVSDRIPEGVVGASLSPDATQAACPVTGGTAVCPPVEIPVGGTVTYTLSGTLAQDATVTPTNTVTVTGGPDPATPTHTAVASPTAGPEPQAKLTVSKVLVTDPVVPGRTVQWRVTVVNNGPSRARNVVITDRVPDGVSGASMVSDEDGTACPVASGTATCPAIDLEVGETASYTLSGTLAQDATVTPTNTVTVTGGPDPATPTHTAVASPTAGPEPQANLVVAKVLVTDPVVPGQQIQWRVTVTNHGPSRARNVVVTDRVPVGVSNASMAAQDGTACAVAGGTATCPAVEIEAGESLTWTLTGTLDADAVVTPTNTVTVTGGPDPATPTHTAVASPTAGPEPQANLVVAKVLVTDPVVPGQQIQWRVTVTNHGPSRARNVVVTDRVPAGVDGASMAADDGSACPIADGTATCPAVEIEAGGTRTWTLTGTLQAGATVTPTNTVTVTGGPDPATPTHTAVASPSATPVQEARLSVSKSLLTDPVVPGRRIQWQVSVTNRGPSVARDVVVADRVPAGVNDASMAADDGTACAITGGTAVCPAVGIPVGATRTWTLTGTLDPAATVTPTNTVTVTGGPDPATPTHTAVASPSATPVQEARLAVAKVLVTNPVVPGAPVEWRVTVTNDGPSLARGVVVTDRIPAGVLDASMTAQDGATCPIADGTATCPAVGIPVGRTLVWTVKGTLDPGATVTPTNTVTVTGGPDPATPTHTAVASPSESPAAQARLSVAKVLLTDPVVAGQRIQWRVTVTNHGPSRARNVVVTDRVPAGVNGASMAADDGTACPVADGTATCPAVEIPVGGTAGWTLTGTLDADATAVPVNTVVVTGGPDPDATDRTAVATPTGPIAVRHDLLLTKRATPTGPGAGDRVTYTVTATNRASGTYFGAVVTDDLSGVLDGAVYGLDARADTGRTAYAAPRLTWTLDLRPGATATLSYTVTVKPGAAGTTLVNRLSADGSNCSGGADASGSGSGGGAGARRAAAVSTSGNCSTTTTVRGLPSPSPSPTTRPPLPPTGSGSPKPALLVTVLLLALGGLLVAARRSRR